MGGLGAKTPRMTLAFPLVALGGALGAVLRYFVLLLWPAPWGVLAVNVAGSFVIGLLAERLPPPLALFLITGVLGGFTTFSAFALETDRLLVTAPATALAYVALSTAGGLALAAAGLRLARR